MKPAILGAVGLGAFAAAIAAVFVFLDDGGRPAAPPSVLAAPKGPAPAAAKGGGTDGIQPLLAEAERLLNRGDTPAAKSTYIRAREQAKRQNSVAAEAAVAFGLGRLEHSNGQSDAARAAFNEALALYRQVNDAVAEVRVLVAFGDLEKDTFRGAQAKRYYGAAREQWAVVPEPKSDPHVVLNMDRAPLMLAGEARARAVLDQAAKIFHNIGDAESEGDVAMLTGALELNLGLVGPASAAFQAARLHYSDAAIPAKEADAALNVALTDIQQGYNIAAADNLRASTELWAGDALGGARVLAARGDLERLQGRVAEARSAYAGAVPALAAAGHSAAAEYATKLAVVQRALRDADSAVSTLQGAVELAARTNPRADGPARLELGLLLAVQGNLSAAKPHLTAAAEALRRERNTAGEARALLGLGAVAALQNDTAVAIANLDGAAERFASSHLPLGAVQASLAKGDAYRGAGNTGAAAAAYREALTLRRGIEAAVAEASRLLGLPAVGQVQYVALGEETHDENPPDPAIVKAAQATRAANLAAFPEANWEGRELLKEIDARLAAVAEFARVAN